MTRAPWPAAIRAARTPPEPPPMTNRSTSNSAMVTLPGFYFLTRFLRANRYPIRSKTLWKSYLLAAFAHLGAEFAIDGFGKDLRPLIHIGHAELNCPWLGGEQFLAERRFVERDQVLQFLFGKLVGIDLRHSLPDIGLTARKLLGDDDGNLIEILLIVEVALHQLIPGLLNDVGDRAGVHGAGVFHGQNLLCRGDRCRRSLLERRRRCRCLLGNRWNAGDGQSKRKACGRQNSRKSIHSILLRLRRYGRSTTRIPSEPARIAVLERPMNSPCSTTPGITASNPARRGASAIRPRWASTIQWPPSVTKTWPSLPFRTTICPETPLCANASPMARRVAARPNATTSTGNGKRPRTSTHLESSAITIMRSDAAATIFSRNSAPPPPLMTFSAGSISSAPSTVRSSRSMASSVVRRMPHRSAWARVASEVGTPMMFMPPRTWSPSRSTKCFAVEPVPSP